MAIDSSERLVNLALYLSRDRSFSTIDDIRFGVEGYDREGSTDAFERMFEHDKDNLRAAGLTIQVDEATQGYRIDPALSFASEIALEPREAAMIRAVGGLILADAEFPLKRDLRLALAKIGSSIGGIDALAKSVPTAGSDSGDPRVAMFEDAINRSKHVTFVYEKPDGSTDERIVEPYGLARYADAWYVVGYDRMRENIRMFRIDRASDVAVNPRLPKSEDFERPAEFDIADHLGLEFQFGIEGPHQAELAVEPGAARIVRRFMERSGSLHQEDDGSLVWHVEVTDTAALIRWVVANGPGIEILSPPELVESLRSALDRVEVSHGSPELG